MRFEKGQMMAGYKSVIELLVEELAGALERIGVLEKELDRLRGVVNDENETAIRAVLRQHQ